MAQTPGDRLRQARMDAGYSSAREAARNFSWHEVTYRSHENGNREFDFPAAQKYGNAFKVDPIFLLTGRGQKRNVEVIQGAPVVGTISAGVFREDVAELIAEPDLVPFVPRPDIPASAQYALRIDGNSINKIIPDGAYAICARLEYLRGFPEDGTLVHVIRERAGLIEETIKKLVTVNGKRMLRPASSDARHQTDIPVDGDELTTIEIRGIVIGSFQPI